MSLRKSTPTTFDPLSDELVVENARLFPKNRYNASVDKVSDNLIRIQYYQPNCTHVKVVETTSESVKVNINSRGDDEIMANFSLIGDQKGKIFDF